MKRKRIKIQEEKNTEFLIDGQNTLTGVNIDANKKIVTVPVILILFYTLIFKVAFFFSKGQKYFGKYDVSQRFILILHNIFFKH